MKQETLEQAVDVAAVLGRKVAVFALTLRQADDLARRFERAAPEIYVSGISRTAGRRRIDFHSGGSIRFLSTNRSGRGLSVDRVLVPRDASHLVLADIVPMTQGSEDGQITGY